MKVRYLILKAIAICCLCLLYSGIITEVVSSSVNAQGFGAVAPAPTPTTNPFAGAVAAGGIVPTYPITAKKCAGANGTEGIETAIGCLPTEPSGFTTLIFTFGLSMGGGIAFIFFAIGGFTLITAQGIPEKINMGKQIIMAALAGLLFIIFSVYLLRFIGFNVLQIAGFR